MRLITNPWVILGVLVALGTSCTAGYVGGRTHEADKWKAKEAKLLQSELKQKQIHAAKERALVELAVRKDGEITELHRRLNNEIHKVTRNTSCLSTDAVGVWNRAFDSIRSVPESSGRVSEAGAVSNAVGATDREVLQSANEVAEILNMCREQINNIRQWDAMTFEGK
jgi:hypothetical protein